MISFTALGSGRPDLAQERVPDMQVCPYLADSLMLLLMLTVRAGAPPSVDNPHNSRLPV
jgi:hypothetical protein